MTGVAALALVLVAAFAVDLGMQRVARRDMQSLADVVALDLARELDGRTVAELQPLMPGLADQSRLRNDATLGEVPRLAVVLGELDAWGEFVELAGDQVPTAVRVTSSTTVGFALAGGSGGAQRDAVADLQAGACFLIGSYGARLDTGRSPVLGTLLGVLGSDLSLGAVDYQGLVTSEVTLAHLLASRLAAGTVESLVQADGLVRLGDYYLAVAEALERGSGRTATVVLLEALALDVGDTTVRAGDLLGLDTTGASGLDATLGVYDLVTAAAATATGEHGLEVPQAEVALGPVAGVASTLHVTEGLRPGCGREGSVRATASSTQLGLELHADAADVAVPGLLRTNVALSGTVQVAAADGRLTDVRCDPPGITVAVTDGLVDVDLTLEVQVYAKVLLATVKVAEGPIRITGSRSSTGEAVIDVVGGDYDQPVRVGDGTSGLPTLAVDTSGVRLVGLPVGVVLSPILDALTTGLVDPLVTGLDTVLLGPLLNSLGLDLSGADVFARPTPRCDEPSLVG